MADVGLATAKLDIGQVARVTFGVLRRNLAPFLIVSSVLSGIPSLAFGLLTSVVVGAAPGTGEYNLLAFAGGAVGLITGTVLQAALIHLTAADLNSRRASVGDALTTGLRNMMPLIWLSLLYGLGVGAASVLLLVPGLILLVMWSVGAPVLIVERRGVTASLTRSGVLTKGSRWRIFGLMMIYGVITVVIQLVLTALIGGFSSGAAATPTAVVGSTVIAVLSGMIGATGAAVLYTELRRIKDGVGISELAAIFD